METLLGSLLIASSLVGLVVLFQIQRRKNRRLRLKGLELRPNCLLTRHPIAFVAGARSLFRLFDHWNEIPSYLREHGYEVIVIEPDARAKGAAVDVRALDGLPEKCHLIGDASLESELTELARTGHANIASITVVMNQQRRRPLTPRRDRVASFRHGSEALKPLPIALETFELNPETLNLENPQTTVWRRLTDALSRLLLAGHNLISSSATEPVDPIETADLDLADPWAIEARFLELAIRLAERDANLGAI